MEPPLKKIKINDASNIVLDAIDKYIETIQCAEKQLKVVMNFDIYDTVPLAKVFVGHIKNVKDISHTILTLNEKVPLKELQHLKRVRRHDVILCPVDYLQDKSSIQEYLECHVTELKDVFDYFKEVEVPKLPPKVTTQLHEARKYWSCNFHPNIYLEKLVKNDFFSEFELTTHRRYMAVVFEIAKWYALQMNTQYIGEDIFENINATVVVDPTIDRIVAVSYDNRLNHPLQHSAMLAIDNVAKTQNGGAWSSETTNCNTDILLPYLKSKFPQTKFGCREFISKQDQRDSNEEGPYLCTGYYVYLLKEPCFMCSMALVHARAKKLFFCLSNLEHGALLSKTKLQGVSSLNHHFEVFTGFL